MFIYYSCVRYIVIVVLYFYDLRGSFGRTSSLQGFLKSSENSEFNFTPLAEKDAFFALKYSNCEQPCLCTHQK